MERVDPRRNERVKEWLDWKGVPGPTCNACVVYGTAGGDWQVVTGRGWHSVAGVETVVPERSGRSGLALLVKECLGVMWRGWQGETRSCP